MRRLYWARKLEGHCVSCERDAGQHTRCSECRADAVEKTRRWREKVAA